MAGKPGLVRQVEEGMRRWRAEERARARAALTLAVKECPDNIIAFLWLARCVTRPEGRAPRRIPHPSAARRNR